MTPQSEPEAVPETVPGAVPEAVPVRPPDAETVMAAPLSDAPPLTAPMPADEGAWSAPVDWQRLPPRAKRVFLYVALMVAVPPTLVASTMLYESLPSYAWPWLVIAGLWTVSLSFAIRCRRA